jgi:hypothetical protein
VSDPNEITLRLEHPRETELLRLAVWEAMQAREAAGDNEGSQSLSPIHDRLFRLQMPARPDEQDTES